MNNIGRYQGTPCYECSDREYKDALSKGHDDGAQIFIIDGTMVRRNIIIGYYDGKNVRDVYDHVPYVVMHEPGPQREMTKTANEPVKVSVPVGETYEEVTSREINFADYSKVVDEFFAHLDA
jgi:hypothetical protein